MYCLKGALHPSVKKYQAQSIFISHGKWDWHYIHMKPVTSKQVKCSDQIHPCVTSRNKWIPLTLHYSVYSMCSFPYQNKLTFAGFPESLQLCSLLPPFQASAPSPSALITLQKALSFFYTAFFCSLNHNSIFPTLIARRCSEKEKGEKKKSSRCCSSSSLSFRVAGSAFQWCQGVPQMWLGLPLCTPLCCDWRILSGGEEEADLSGV